MIDSPIFVVCEWCGNKRCPHALNKSYKCTDSNELGQVGQAIESGELSPQWSVFDKTDMGILLGSYSTRALAEGAMREHGYSNIGHVGKSR